MGTLLAWLSAVILGAALLILLSKKTAKNCLPLPPGPPGWPIVGSLFQLGPKPHQTLQAMSLLYGPLFHLKMGSIHVVVAASASVASLFLKTNDANFCNRPPNTGAKYMAYDCRDLVWAPYGPRWRMLRKICTSHLFSSKALDDFSPIRQDEMSALVSSLLSRGEAGSRAVEVGNWLTVCTANVLTRAMLGKRLFSSEGKREDMEMAREFKEMSVSLTRLAGAFVIADYVPALRWLDTKSVVEKMKDVGKRADVFLDKILKEHLMMGPSSGGTSSDSHHREHNQKDMMRMLLDLKNDAEGAKLNDTEIKALLLDLFSAGTDTSSSTTEWALSELIRQPELLTKVQQEIDTVVGRERLVSEADLPNLPLLDAVIKETFRLHPSTPLSLPHIASEDCHVNGYLVPKNATLLVNVWAIGRDAAVWDDPLRFDPGRFLPGGKHAGVDLKGNHFEIIPFGAGRRICAGMNWGLRMVQLMAATLVHAFDWDLPLGNKADEINMDEQFGLTLQRAQPLQLHPRPRLAATAYGEMYGAAFL